MSFTLLVCLCCLFISLLGGLYIPCLLPCASPLCNPHLPVCVFFILLLCASVLCILCSLLLCVFLHLRLCVSCLCKPCFLCLNHLLCMFLASLSVYHSLECLFNSGLPASFAFPLDSSSPMLAYPISVLPICVACVSSLCCS